MSILDLITGLLGGSKPTNSVRVPIPSEAWDPLAPLMKRMEGERFKEYDDTAGHGTIGYGHKLVGNESEVFKGGISELAASLLLDKDIRRARAIVDRHVTNPNLTPFQRDALTSFAFNVGEGAFEDSSVLTHVNRGDHEAAMDVLLRYEYAGGKKDPGLKKRRLKEKRLYQFPINQILRGKPRPPSEYNKSPRMF